MSEEANWVRLEYRQGSSNKFWQWTKTGPGAAMVQWGRIGTRGQFQEVTIDEAASRYAEKIRKGYQLVGKEYPGERVSERVMRLAASSPASESRRDKANKEAEKVSPKPRKSRRIVEIE